MKKAANYFLFLMAAFFICLPAQDAHAEAKIYVGNNVYKKTVKRWTKAASDASFSSISWVWNLGVDDRKHRNGRRDTVLIVPETAIPEDITLVVWFHGLGGFSQKGFVNRIIPQMESLVADDNSFAVAIPEMPWSTNTSTPRKRQGRVWTKPGSLEKYIKDLREHLETWAIITHGRPLGNMRLVFVGHSAGGSTIMAASKEGGLCRLKPDAIIWSDASYGYWLDSAWNSCIKNLDADTQLHILVRKWDKPHKNAQRAMKSINRKRRLRKGPHVRYQVLDRKAWTHGRIGNNVFNLTDVFPPGC